MHPGVPVGDLLYIVIVIVIAFFTLMFGLLVLCGRTLGASERDASPTEQAPAGEQGERSQREPSSSA